MRKLIFILLFCLCILPAHAYTAYKTVAFGSTQTGQTVSFSVKDSTGASVSSGVSGTVVELGGGGYGAAITVPDGSNYFVVWSETNGGVTYTATDKIEAQASQAIATAASVTSNGTAIASIPSAVLSATVDGALTVKNVLTLLASISGWTRIDGTLNTTAHTQTVTYKNQAGSTVAVATVTYAADNKTTTGRTVVLTP